MLPSNREFTPNRAYFTDMYHNKQYVTASSELLRWGSFLRSRKNDLMRKKREEEVFRSKVEPDLLRLNKKNYLEIVKNEKKTITTYFLSRVVDDLTKVLTHFPRTIQTLRKMFLLLLL